MFITCNSQEDNYSDCICFYFFRYTMKHMWWCRSTGLLILRVGVGAWLLYHGILKLGASEQMVTFVWSAANNVGLTFFSVETWFQIARAAEIVAGIGLILGIFTSLAAVLWLLVLLFAANSKGRSIQKAEMDFAYIIMLVSLAFAWGGKYSLDGLLCHKHCASESCCSTGGGSCCKDKPMMEEEAPVA